MRKGTRKSLFVLTMALVMLFSMIPFGAAAVNGENQSGGQEEALSSYAEENVFPVPATEFNITYVLGVDGATHSNPATSTAADLPLTLTDPIGPAGYVFRGWRPSDRIPVGTDGDVTFTASWFRFINRQLVVFIEGNYRIEISAQHQGSNIRFGVRTYYDGILECEHENIRNYGGQGRFWQYLNCNLGFSFRVYIQGNDLQGAVERLLNERTHDIVYQDYDGSHIARYVLRHYRDQQTVRDAPPVPPTRPGHVFGGWIRSCNGDTYQPGRTFRMPDNDVVFTAQWRPRTDLGYTVRYYRDTLDAAGFIASVAGQGTVGAVVPIDPTYRNLHRPTGYQEGVVQAGSQLTITADPTDNVIRILYLPRNDITLTVNYFLQGTTDSVAPTVTRTGLTMGAVRTETALTIAGHTLVSAPTQTIELAETGNVITFFYTAYYEEPIESPGTIAKRADRRVTLIEHPINYIITVTNTSDEVMSGFTVTDEIDRDLVRFAAGTLRVNGEVSANATYADGVIRVELDDIAPGGVVVIRFGVIVSREAAGEVIHNTATLSHPNHGDLSVSESVEVEVLSIVPNLTHFSYLIGYDDGTVRPRAEISRAEVATIFFRLICDEYRADIWSQENNFRDVSMRHWHNNAVSTMANAEFLLGYRDGTFRPNNAITRAEFATIVSRFMNVRYTGANRFSDIDGHWAATAINSVAYVGWVTGYGDGTFRPNSTITRAEAAAIVNRIFLRHPESVEDLLPGMITWPDNANRNMWYYLHIQEATNSHNHEMKDCGIFETWTELIPARDWRVLQLPTSTPQCIMN